MIGRTLARIFSHPSSSRLLNQRTVPFAVHSQFRHSTSGQESVAVKLARPLAVVGCAFAVAWWLQRKNAQQRIIEKQQAANRWLIHGQRRVLREKKFAGEQLYQYGFYIVTNSIISIWHKLHNLAFGKDDVIIVGFPAAGTDLLLDVVAAIVGGESDAKQTARKHPLLDSKAGLNHYLNMTGPRLMVSHMPPSILFQSNYLPEDPKMLIVMRNPKDLLLAYYQLSKSWGNDEDLDQFVNRFRLGTIPYGPVWEHVNECWYFQEEKNKSEDSKVLVLFYEDLLKDFKSEVQKICQFLGRPQLVDEQINRLKNNYFNVKTNPRIESVEIGEWKRSLNNLQIEQINKMEKHINSKIKFQYE